MATIFLQKSVYTNWPAIRGRGSKTLISKIHSLIFGLREVGKYTNTSSNSFCIQIRGILYVHEFKGLDLLTIAFGFLNIWCVNSIRTGLLGVWENDLQLLEGYYVSSQCATMFTCAFVYQCSGAESTRTWMGMNPSNLCLYLYILFDAMVEITQPLTTMNLIEDLTPA